MDAAIRTLEPHVAEIEAAFGLEVQPVRGELVVDERQCRLFGRSWYQAVAFVDQRTPEGRGRIVLCGPFFKRSAEDESVTLGHEMLHVLGLPDTLDGVSHEDGSLSISEHVRTIVRGR